jgi:hypothetical protein
VLSVTLNTLHDSQKSYKRIRYAIGVATGTEGTLSTSLDLPHAMDDDADLPAESVTVTYTTTQVLTLQRGIVSNAF